MAFYSRLPFCLSSRNCCSRSSTPATLAKSSSLTRSSDVAPVNIASVSFVPAVRLVRSIGELGWFSAHMCRHRQPEVFRLKHGRVPGGDIIEPICNAVITAVANHFLGSANGQRGLRGNLAGN